MEEYITRHEHDEFSKRLEAQDKRQDKRIGLLEENLREVSRQSTAIEKLANSMDVMAKEQEKQGKRLEKLESAPAETWSTLKVAFLTAIGTAAGTAIIAAFIATIV